MNRKKMELGLYCLYIRKKEGSHYFNSMNRNKELGKHDRLRTKAHLNYDEAVPI
jgi:hypothetical protein